MSAITKAIRGMNDILPAESATWTEIENRLKSILRSYAYSEIRLPIIEKTELFKRTIGEATDIVEKEMYTFLDRNEESLTLRPEGTAGCVRAGIEHGLFYHQTQKLWYMGPYFRYERPQKGRYRQFHQCGVEIFGISTPDSDAELILTSARILKSLGLQKHVTLELNSLGSSESRKAYRINLVDYLQSNKQRLDEDSLRRLETNPLRILDSKNPMMKDLIQDAPKLIDHLDADSSDHFLQLQSYLRETHVQFTINPCLVRGLDYYTKTVFEWITTDLGAQGTICAGGRYDNLVEQLGGPETPALGFAIGMERLLLLYQQVSTEQLKPSADIYMITTSNQAQTKALSLLEQLREHLPEVIIQQNFGGGSFKNQFKKADKSQAQYALIIGDDELKTQTVSLKFLRSQEPQQTIPENQFCDVLQKLFCV